MCQIKCCPLCLVTSFRLSLSRCIYFSENMDHKKEEDDPDYDPHTSRDLPHPTNDIESLAHILKGILGTGVLAIPEGFNYAGGVMAIIYSFLSGVLCTVGMHVLITGFYMVCKAHQLPVVSYTNAMRFGLAMGPPSLARYNEIIAKTTDFFVVFYQCGVICIYILFVSVTLERVTNNLLDKEIPLGFYMLIIVIPCMLINSLKNLKVLGPFSYISLGVTVFVIFLIFYYLFRDGLPPYGKTRKYYNDIWKLPMFFGTTVYSFTSVPVVVSVENNMKTPKHFHRIYNIGIAFILVLYLSVGYFSYWKWGDDLQSAVNLNFPQHEILAIIGNYSYALAIFISIGLNGIVPVKLLMNTYISKRIKESVHPVLWEYILCIGLITICYVGGPVSLLALQGVFTLMQEYNLEYPNIFAKLYSMFEPEIFHTKFKARLFYLSDIFLSSTHLSENLVAAFAKRLARLALITPSEDIIVICMFIGNLILRHPGLKCLLNHPGGSTGDDPYIMEERDPLKSNAIHSSLWEILTLQQHALPCVATAARFISNPLLSVEWDLGNVLDSTADTIFDREIKKNGKLLALAFDKDFTAKRDKVAQYWEF